MGSLNLPHGCTVCVDTQVIIYTVERHPTYASALLPVWAALQQQSIRVVTSELTIMETMVRPMRDGNAQLLQAYRSILLASDIALVPVDQAVLMEAARLRAAVPTLRSPDAIHAATARLTNSHLLLTNDRALAKLSGINILLVDDVGV